MSTETVMVKILRPINYDGKRRERDELLQMRKTDIQLYADNKLVEEIDPSAIVVSSVIDGETKWPVDGMTPAEYLEKFPSGPHADLALEILALSDDEPTDTEGDEPNSEEE